MKTPGSHQPLTWLLWLALSGLVASTLAIAWYAFADSAHTDAAAAQQAPVYTRGVWVDESASLNIQAVVQQPFASAPNPLMKGFTKAAIWQRVRVQASGQAQNLVLYVLPAYIDDVQFYHQAKDGTWQIQQAGDLFAYAMRERKVMNFSFALQVPAGESADYYLRMQGRNSLMPYIVLMTSEAAQQFDRKFDWFIGLYFGMMLFLGAFSITRGVLLKDVLWSLNAATVVVNALLAATQTGLASMLLRVQQSWRIDAMHNLLACQLTLVSGLFFMVFLRVYRAPAWTWTVYALSALVFPLLIFLLWTEQTQTALQINALLLVAQHIWGLFVVWFVRFEDRLQTLMMRAVYVSIAALALLMTLSILGWFRLHSLVVLYPGIVGNIMATSILVGALQRRDFIRVRQLAIARQQAIHLQDDLRAEQARRAESAAFMAMLMHELKTPLAALRMAVMNLVSGRVPDALQTQKLQRMNEYVDAADGVLERARALDQLEQGGIRLQLAQHDASALVREAISLNDEPSRVSVSAPEELPVQTDAQLLGLMLRNLLENALRYSPPASPVVVSLQADAHAQPTVYTIAVENAVGKCGLPDVQKLFTKYYRADRARERPGTGLGLYWVRSVAALMGGQITYSHTASHIRFELRFPYEP